MVLRTPRRRISPRTKQRYRVLRNFFRRALGSSSQQDIQITSSIAVNVTDLNHKIIGLEQQLSEVNKHCHDLASLENNLRRESDNQPTVEKQYETMINEQTDAASDRKSIFSDTKLIYKNTGEPFKRSDDSDCACNECSNNSDRNYTRNMNEELPKLRNRKNKVKDRTECDTSLRKHRAQSNFENFTSGYSTSNFHSLSQAVVSPRVDPEYNRHRYSKKYVRQREYSDYPVPEQTRRRRHKSKTKRNKTESPTRYEDNKHVRSRKDKCGDSKLDQDFIAEIIKRQYKPVKLFGARRSDLSQFSAPMCRDQEYSINENILEGEDLCSCCFEHNRARYARNHGLTDMRSICDTRLYSSDRHVRNKRRRRPVDIYNDSTLYDVIPVKEKTSPKTRRKFVENDMIPNEYYREVPPSPRTLRPRLNLKAQYYSEYDEEVVPSKHQSRRSKRQLECIESAERGKQKSQKINKYQNPVQVSQQTGTISNIQYSPNNSDQNNANINEISLNKTQETDISLDKTDKALSEIKDILQSFLLEIKKDSTPSQCEKSDINTYCAEKHLGAPQDSIKVKTNIPLPNSNNSSGPQCISPPYISPFMNQCCYPIMPVCPVNCMQSGYVIPSPSFECHACASNQKEIVCQECSKNKKDNGSSPQCNETDKLIKEIYKFVAQSPLSGRKRHDDKLQTAKNTNFVKKQMTTRSVGGSSKPSRHDAKVGTPTLKCYSKSCEAIGSRMMHEGYCANTTHSDTILEKLSLEVTQSDTELSSRSILFQKAKESKFAKVLRSFGLLKKKRKEDRVELSESDSSVEVEIKKKPKPPYRQDIMNYMMHEQEYHHRPSVGAYHPRPERPYGHAGYDPRVAYPYPMAPPITELYTPHRVHQQTIHEHAAASNYHPSAPPYPHYDHHCNPQVPFCLKEIEVRSTGTQSERKMSFFRKLTKSPPPRATTVRNDPLKNNFTQTKEKKQGFFSGWKSLQEKAKEIEQDPMKFSFNTQKKLAEGDTKMRNAMMKKMFYKRNPFSPGNLITKTILGRDKSSYGDPPQAFRPRLFF